MEPMPLNKVTLIGRIGDHGVKLAYSEQATQTCNVWVEPDEPRNDRQTFYALLIAKTGTAMLLALMSSRAALTEFSTTCSALPGSNGEAGVNGADQSSGEASSMGTDRPRYWRHLIH